MSTPGRTDLYKQHAQEYTARIKPVLVDVGPANYLAIPGKGPPGGPAFQAALQALYSMAFTIKMTWKFSGKGDYKVCHLEGIFWNDPANGKKSSKPAKEAWEWKLLIRIPEFITDQQLQDAKKRLEQKKKPPEFNLVNLETISEGKCVQMLHIGPYDQTRKGFEIMRKFASENGVAFHARLHEIYLSDPRRMDPQRLRTILRNPVK